MAEKEMGMLGYCVRRFSRFCVRRYYRQMIIDGADQIPQEGSLLICANHPNSLFDPIVLGIAARRPVRFLAKAPLFKIPVLGRVMYALGMIPAYRGRDSKRDVSRNNETLDAAAQALIMGTAIGVFPEGVSHDRVGLEMVRSGASRIAQQAIAAGANGLFIAPVGLNFEDKERFRSDVWVRVGQPIDVDRWLEQQPGTEKQQQRQLTEMIGESLRGLVIHLDDAQWEPYLEILDAMDLQLPNPAQQPPTATVVFQRRQSIADLMNEFIVAEPDRATALGARLKKLDDDLAAKHLSIKGLASAEAGRSRVTRWLWTAIAVVGLMPLAILGLIHHVIPFFINRAISSRYHSKQNRTDVSLYRLLFSLPIYAIAYAVIAAIVGWNVGFWFALVWILLAPVAGVIAYEYWPWIGRLFVEAKEHQRLRSGDPAIRTMSEAYRGLVSDLNDAINAASD